MFGWFDPKKREQRRKIRLDRKYLAARSRRFLRNYLNADNQRKSGYYRALNQLTAECRPTSVLSSPEITDTEIAEATSQAAMTKVLERLRLENAGSVEDFITDAYCTIAVAYHRSTGVYASNPGLQKLGTAAVHLLTIATSYSTAQIAGGNDRG